MSPAVEPDRELIVFASRLPLSSRTATPRFLVDTLTIKRQLDRLARSADGGLVWYELRADLRDNVYWTASAWTDDASLSGFVRATPHVDVMRRAARRLGAFDSVRWTVTGANLPRDLATVRDRLRVTN